MIWQDLVISVGQFVFAAAMIPTIRGNSKPALLSSVVTATGLSAFALTFSTLDLWWSVAGTATGALTWWVVAVQSYTARPGWRYFSGRPPERQVKIKHIPELELPLRHCVSDDPHEAHDWGFTHGDEAVRDYHCLGEPVDFEDELIYGSDPYGPEPKGIFGEQHDAN